MRRLALALLVAGLPLGGCADILLSTECEDECVEGERECDGDSLYACRLELLLSTCTWWDLYQDCRDRGLVCRDAMCTCPPGLIYCGACVNPMVDPDNCGNCGVSCVSRVCTNGLCSP